MQTLLMDYLRSSRLPHIWCPGCGNGLVMGSLIRAMDDLKLKPSEIAIVSGIGCSSRAAGYLNLQTLHTTHGRAVAFATGLKMARPELKIFIIMGDGDSTAIGGNHFIHAARRNIDLNVLIFNNSIYGMTGGQASPLTPQGKLATTAPYGNAERNFDIMNLARGAGATFCARATTYHLRMLDKLIQKAVHNKGFSVIEAITPCPIGYGRRNKLGDASDMLKSYKEQSVTYEKSRTMDPEELKDKIVVGIHHEEPAPEFVEEYSRRVSVARK